MMPIKFAKFLVLALALTVAAAGCKKTPIKPTEITGGSGGTLRPRGPEKPIISEPPAAPVAKVDDAPVRTTDDGTSLPGRPGNFGSNPGGRNTGPGTGFPIPGGTPTTPRDDGSKDGIKMASRAGFDGMVQDETILEKQAVYFDFDSSAVKASEKHKIAPVAEYLKSNLTHKIRIYGNCDERGTEEYNRSLGERRALALRTELLGQVIDSERIDTVTNGKDKPKALGHDEASWRENRRGDFVVLLPPAAP